MAKRIRRRSTKRSQRRLRKRLTKRRVSKRRLSKRRVSKGLTKRRLSKRCVRRGGKPVRESTDYMSQLPSENIHHIANQLPLKDLQSLIFAYPLESDMAQFLKLMYDDKLPKFKLLRKLIPRITSTSTTVKLSNNEAVNDGTINEILDGLTVLPNLQRLDLSNNRLTALPESLGNLSNLKYLFLRHNALTALPSSLGNLSELQYLHLNDNALTALPEEPFSVGNLPNLQYLNLSNNTLTDQDPVVLELRGRGPSVIV